MKLKIIFFAILIMTVTDAAAQITSWTDENGVKHYSNTNPPNDAENIKTFDEYIPPGNFKRQNYHKIKKKNPKKCQAGNIKSFGNVHSGSRPAVNRSLNIKKNINPIRPAVNKNLNMKKRYPAANIPNNKGSKPLDFSNAFWELWYIWLILVISLALLMAADLFKYKIIGLFIKKIFSHEEVMTTNCEYAGSIQRLFAAVTDIILLIIVILPVFLVTERIVNSLCDIEKKKTQRMIEQMSRDMMKNIHINNKLKNEMDRIDKSFLNHMADSQSEIITTLIKLLQIILIPAVFTIMFWIYKSSTPGKMLASIQIADERSFEKPSNGQFLVRYLGYFVSVLSLGVGFIWIFFDSKKQCLHDKLSSTVVVCLKRNELPDETDNDLKKENFQKIDEPKKSDNDLKWAPPGYKP
ncbi:MAG: DUF4124 domain-containing protein [Desulfobacteraceae bacterium]|nr:DUF4124 domain-containing protein [Desulfobacteraceae bacterium]